MNQKLVVRPWCDAKYLTEGGTYCTCNLSPDVAHEQHECWGCQRQWTDTESDA